MKFKNVSGDGRQLNVRGGVWVDPDESTPDLTADEATGIAEQTDIWQPEGKKTPTTEQEK